MVVASFIELVADRSLSLDENLVTAGQLMQMGVPGLERVDPSDLVVFTLDVAIWLVTHNDTFYHLTSSAQNSAASLFELRREELEKNSERSQPGLPEGEPDVASAETNDLKARLETTPPLDDLKTP